jgi:hypothetical protein
MSCFTFNWLIYYSSIITGQELHVSCYIVPVSSRLLVFLIQFIPYVQYNFYTRMSGVTHSHFAKYFCDIYYKYIALCAIIIYAMFDAIWVTPS